MKSTGTWPKWLPWLLGALVLFQIVVVCTSPFKDGDIFFHMVYGRTAFDEKTLISDHSLYTWTATSNETLYCAWIAQIFFYLLHSWGGFAFLFAFKYLLALIFIGLLLHIAKLTGLLKLPMTWVFCIVGLSLSAHSGVVLKPEAFSFLGIVLFCYIWIRIRLSEKQSSYISYFYPLLLAIWVNSHGGVIFGASFLFLVWLGEQINARFSPAEALPRGTLRHLFIACLLSIGALFVNPYGAAYPIFLAEGTLGANVEELKTVSDYASAFSSVGNVANLPSFFFIALALFALVIRDSIREKRVNWVVVLTNLFFAFLFCYMLRTAYFWGVILSFSSLYLLKDSRSILQPKTKWIRVAQGVTPVVFALTFSLVLLYKKTYQPGGNFWFGYGMSVRNPQEEAEYVRENLLKYKLGNDYDSGTYLMWTLYPEQKHMIDQRYFPFVDWYALYHNAFIGIETEDFVSKADCEIWCIGFHNTQAIDWFRNSPEWDPLFYGRSAVIFGKSDLKLEPATPLGGETIENIRGIGWAGYPLIFATNMRDWDGAFRVYRGMSRNFPGSKMVLDARRFLEGALRYRAHDFDMAAERLTPLEGGSSFRNDVMLLKSCLHTTVSHWRKEDFDSASSYAQLTVLIAPQDPMAHYNYGITHAFLEGKGHPMGHVEGIPDWRDSLQAYVDGFEGFDYLPEESLPIAKKALNEGIEEKPELIEPEKPDPENIGYYQELLEQLD